MPRAMTWARRLSFIALVVIVVLLLVYVLVVPMIARKVARQIFDGLGMPDAALEVRGTSLYNLQIVNIADRDDRLRVGSVDVSYTPSQLMDSRVEQIDLTGVQWSMRVRDGKVDFSPFDGIKSSGGAGEMPFKTVRVRSSSLTVDWDGEEFVVPIEGKITAEAGGKIDLDLRGDFAGATLLATGSITPAASDPNARDIDAVLRMLGTIVRVEGHTDSGTGDVNITAVATLASQQGEVARIDKAGTTIRDRPLTITADYQRASGQAALKLTVDGAASNLAPGVGAEKVTIDHLDVRGELALNHEQNIKTLKVTLGGDGMTWRALRFDRLDILVNQSDTRLTADVRALAPEYVVSVQGDVPSLHKLMSPSSPTNPRDAHATWRVEGQPPAIVLEELARLGVDIKLTEPVVITGEGRGALAHPGDGAALAPWSAQLSSLRATTSGVDITLPKRHIQIRSVAGDLKFRGRITPDAFELMPEADSKLDIGGYESGEGEQMSRVGAVSMRLPQPDDDAAADPAQPGGYGLRWSRADGRWLFNGALASHGPIEWTGAAEAMKATFDRLRVVTSLTVSPGSESEPAVTVYGAVEVSGGRFNRKLDGLTLTNINGHIPITLHGKADEPGAFSIDNVQYRGQSLNAISGTARMRDGVVDVAAAWPLLESAAVKATAKLNVAGGSPRGTVNFSTESFNLTDADRFKLGELAPFMKDLHVEGGLTLDGRIDVDGSHLKPRITLKAQDVVIRSTEYDAAIEGINGAVTLESFSPLSTPGNQRLNVKSARLGKLTLNDGVMSFRVENPDSIFIERTLWSWGDKGRFWVHAFRLKPSDPEYDVEVFVENLNLNEWLNVVTNGRATGNGLLYGRLPVTFRPKAEQRFNFGRGFLYAQAQEGQNRLQVRDATMVADLLVQSDNRFATDANMRVVKDRIVEALKDFSYNRLAFDFIPREDDLQLKISTAGQGQGPNRVPIENLTVNLNGYDKVLNDKLLVELGSEESIDNALRRLLGK